MTVSSRLRRPHWAVFLGLAVTIVVLDQLSKAWVVANVSPGEVVELIGSYLRLIYTENNGGLFGLFRGNALLFAAVSIGVVALIVAFHARSAPSLATSIALGLLLGGAIGNLIDRLRFGFVVDFVDMGIGDIRFYTYNVADAAISTAIIVLIVLALFPGVGEAIDHSVARRRMPWPIARRPRSARSMVDPASTAGEHRVLVVPEGSPRQRADRFVADMTGLSRSFVQRLIADGQYALVHDGQPVKANTVLSPGSSVELDIPAAEPAYHLTPDPSIAVMSVYEDDDLLVVDKPAGLVVHPAAGHWQGTLVNAPAGPGRTTSAASPASSGRASSTASTATRAAC